MNSYINQVKDYSAFYISKDYSLPKELPESFVQDDRIVLLRKVYGIFPSEAVTLICDTIRNSREFGPKSSFNGGKRAFYLFPTIEPFEISFDHDGKILESTISHPGFLEKSEVLRKIMCIAIERLAQELSWKDTTHIIGCNAIDYSFSKDSEEPLEWHCDAWESHAEHTFIALLSNSDDKESGWEGGDLLYTTARRVSAPDTLEERLKLRAILDKLPSESLNEPGCDVWSIPATMNDAILLGNKGMNHKITRMVPLAEKGQRMILTVFDFGTKDGYSQEIINTRKILI